MRPIARFYPLVPNSDWVARLASLGARLIQLRVKEQPDDIVRQQVRAAKSTCQSFGAQLVVNDHWRIALEEACDFVHLGQEDLATADLKALHRAGMRIGISTHDHDELDIAVAATPDYVALGPIYATALKQMPWGPQGLDRLGEWKRLLGKTPLVAIGGLTVERARLCLAAGADSVAVVGDVVAHHDPEMQARAWLTMTETAA